MSEDRFTANDLLRQAHELLDQYESSRLLLQRHDGHTDLLEWTNATDVLLHSLVKSVGTLLTVTGQAEMERGNFDE